MSGDLIKRRTLSLTSQKEEEVKPPSKIVLIPYTPIPQNITHISNRNISLTEDVFGTYYMDDGSPMLVKRFTWKNHNKIEVQIINYGARVVSIKLPNRRGVVEDVVWGFDDLGGYLAYENDYIGATIGRTSNRIQNGTFVVDQKQFWLNNNDGEHQKNGGFKGFDKMIWTPYVDGSKVILSYTSKDNEERYPGDLFVQMQFELKPKCEFIMNISANTTKTTIVDINNRTLFNLGGHETGEKELMKHVVMLNANCVTLNLENGLPSGKIRNVVYTPNDFQTPKVLGKIITTDFENGYNQNFCVNRGVDQVDGFVGRITHPPSGRILEVYSNQCGVNFYTATELGRPVVKPVVEEVKVDETEYLLDHPEEIFVLVERLHVILMESAGNKLDPDFLVVINLIKKIITSNVNKVIIDETDDEDADLLKCLIRPIAIQYLIALEEAAYKAPLDISLDDLKLLIFQILARNAGIDVLTDEEVTRLSCAQSAHRNTAYNMIIPMFDTHAADDFALSICYALEKHSSLNKPSVGSELKENGMLKMTNRIPSFYKDGRVHGKGGAIYNRQGAMCLQTQNYPNAIHHANFPSPILRPGETYKHNIIYKFWIQTGNPDKWMKRFLDETPAHCPQRKSK